jgi:predicted O-linked N-acetylglucosamine transferase (SPINDLY family)
MTSTPPTLALALQAHQSGDLSRAEQLYRQVLQSDPANAAALHHLGAVRLAVGDLDEAVLVCQRALCLRPEAAETLNNLAVALARQHRLDEAVAYLRQTVALRPDWSEPHINLANMLTEQGQQDEAVACYRQVVQRQPGNAEAHNLLGSALAVQGRLAEALPHFREALRLQPRYRVAHSNLLLALNYDPDIDPTLLFAEHCLWERLHGQGLTPHLTHLNDRSPERRLRVGYLSPDFRAHAIAGFLLPILAAHDPAQVEVFAYAEAPSVDAVTERFRALVSGWRGTWGRNDVEVAKQVRDDGIDILVDLAGHSANNRLGIFTHRPAPVQLSYLGYPNTTGLTTIDCRLTDTIADPPGEPVRHTEELVRLLGCFCCWSPPRDAPAVTPPPFRRRGHITFGSLHHLAKLNGQVIDLWCAVLRAVPAARLLVFRNTLTGESAERMRQAFRSRGIEEDRIELRHAAPEGGYLGVYGDVDILLDSLPWCGHATTCEALWMGVPVLTQRGPRHAGRMSASILTCLGLTDLIAETPEEYQQLAVELASDGDRLADLRCSLRQRMQRSPLCDGASFTRGLEAVYRGLWRRWCDGAWSPLCNSLPNG